MLYAIIKLIFVCHDWQNNPPSDHLIPPIYYHCSWWPGEAWDPNIYNIISGVLILEYFAFNTNSFNTIAHTTDKLFSESKLKTLPNMASLTFNSSRPSAAYMRQWIRPTLVQIMSCRLFGAKPLSNPILGYCSWDPMEETSMQFSSKHKIFHSRISSEKIVCEMGVIFPGGTWVKLSV